MSDPAAPKMWIRTLPWRVRPLLAAAGHLCRLVVRRPRQQGGAAADQPAERARWTVADSFALVALTGLLTLLFRAYLLGHALFIGNTDRLNTYLNLLKFHTESIRAGELTAWNEHMFTGMNTLGIVYTFPNPLTYLLSLASPERFYYMASLVSLALLAAAGWAAYAFLRTLCRHRFFAFVGAALYELSWVVVFNAAQNDMSFVVHIVIPLALLALHRVTPSSMRWPLVTLALLLWGLLFFSFLQVAAYAILLIAAYALHRSVQLKSWAPVVVFLSGFLIALLGAWPRVYTVAQEMALALRNQPSFQPKTFLFAGPREAFRFFSDAWYGRNQEEMLLAGNNIINASEGMQLYISAFAAFLLVGGAVRFKGEMFRLFRCRDGDTSFFLWAVVVCFAVVLVRPVCHLFYLAFLEKNFHHARVVIVAALPACAVVAWMLEALAAGEKGVLHRARGRLWGWTAAACAAFAVVAVVHGLSVAGNQEQRINLDQPPHWLIYSFAKSLLYLPPSDCLEPSPLDCWHDWFCNSCIHPYGARQFFWSLAAVILFCLLLARLGKGRGWRPMLVGSLSLAMLGQLFVSDDFRVNATLSRQPQAGPITNNNDIQVAPNTHFHPPTPAATAAFASRLETTNYRSVLISSPEYPTQCPPHLAHFWKLRLVEGYGTSVPTRLAALPLLAGAPIVQAISYQELGQVDWELLALLNVKYGVVVDDALYRNAAPQSDGSWREARPEDTVIVENPYPVLPRAFFARRVQPVADLSEAVVAMFGEGIYEHKRWAFRHRKKPELIRLEATTKRDAREKQIQHPDLAEESYVEGWPGLDDIAGDDSEAINAVFRGDRVEIRVPPADRWRFLVLNELYHPAWQAQADGRDVPIYPTNAFMRGIAVPPGAREVVLTFQPFVTSRRAWAFYGAALAFLVVGFLLVRRHDQVAATVG